MKQEVIEQCGHKYLRLDECENTLVSMVMLGQIPVYWLDYGKYEPAQVTNQKTIYGASPSRFGIKID